jgi:hypothetical protein
MIPSAITSHFMIPAVYPSEFTSENVDQDGLDLRVAAEDLESGFDLLDASSSSDVQEVGWIPAFR